MVFVGLALIGSFVFRTTMRVVFPSQLHIYYEKGYHTKVITWMAVLCLLLNFGMVVSLSFRVSTALSGAVILIAFGFIFTVTFVEFLKEYRELLKEPMKEDDSK